MAANPRRRRRVSSSPPASGVQAHTPPLALVVDDVAETRALYIECFRLAGWRAEAAVDGEEAIRLARELVPNVVVLEMDLPVVSGWEVARTLKGDARTRDIALVAVAGNAGAAFRRKAAAVGCAGSLAKDCSPSELIERATEALDEG